MAAKPDERVKALEIELLAYRVEALKLQCRADGRGEPYAVVVGWKNWFRTKPDRDNIWLGLRWVGTAVFGNALYVITKTQYDRLLKGVDTLLGEVENEKWNYDMALDIPLSGSELGIESHVDVLRAAGRSLRWVVRRIKKQRDDSDAFLRGIEELRNELAACGQIPSSEAEPMHFRKQAWAEVVKRIDGILSKHGKGTR